MTIKEAVLHSMEDFPEGAKAREIYQNILTQGAFVFSKDAKTPWDSVSSLLVTLVQRGDSRIGRRKAEDKKYRYYLTKFSETSAVELSVASDNEAKSKAEAYKERDLHPIFCTYLKSKSIYAKTIYHEKSSKKEPEKWVHPDIVGASFAKYEETACRSFFNATNKSEAVKLYSYELKKEIRTDYDLKQCFFQAVSNSSWANYGYLVFYDYEPTLKDEMERLNNSFGIGFIRLKSNPYETETLFTAKHKSLDFRSIDKLCRINKDFKDFVLKTTNVLSASPNMVEDIKMGLERICDTVLKTDEEIAAHWKRCHIPVDDSDE